MRKLGQLLLASALMIPILSTGCAEHRQVYAWGPGETTYYVQWEHHGVVSIRILRIDLHAAQQTLFHRGFSLWHD